MNTAIVGINWGDEGKGRMVDLLSENYDVVVRYQGGNNAGHTVVNDKGKFIMNLLPCGIFRESTVNVLGNGMVIDIEHLVGEINTMKSKGISISPANLKISDKATICMPYHKLLDILEEDRLAGKKFGSTRNGIAPVYADKYMKKALRMSDLLHLDDIKSKLGDLIEWKNIVVENGYKQGKIAFDETYDWLLKYGSQLTDYICDVTDFLEGAVKAGKNVMFEAQLGALRDIDYGIYPYTSSSSMIAAYAPIGAGIPFCKVDTVVGVIKAYSSCVGEGPFTVELFGDEVEKLRGAGEEFGARTGRPRRVGGFDVVASKYGVKIQGADYLALTKLDVLAYMDKVPVCVAYEIDGVKTDKFPTDDTLDRAKPIYEYFDGFNVTQDELSKCRTYADLPENVKKYVDFIEKSVNCPIKYISVGAKREDYITVF
jgi:adenylosuccinate synthase